ncbi:MAG: Chaperonin 10 Kd subunit, partial [Candidatus Parcubacteria bacterium]
KVIFQWGDKISIDGEEYYIVRESEVLAVIK